MEKLTSKALDRWFYRLDSDDAKAIYPDITNIDTASFLDDVDERWDSLSFEGKKSIYEHFSPLFGVYAEEERTHKWEIAYDEEIFDTAGANFAGIITDGNRFLFWHAYKDDESDAIEKCHIYNSIFMDCDTEECVYNWTAENDSFLLEVLNNLPEGSTDYCGDDGILKTLKFPETEK